MGKAQKIKKNKPQAIKKKEVGRDLTSFSFIHKISIKRYKSIKQIELKPKRVNIFIGGPNSGKTNILEAINFFGINAIDNRLSKNFFRYKTLKNLFYDGAVDQPFSIKLDDSTITGSFGYNDSGIAVNQFNFNFSIPEQGITGSYTAEHDGRILTRHDAPNFQTSIKYYHYKNIDSYSESFRPYLSPPHGENLPGLLLRNSEFLKHVSAIFNNLGYRLMLKPETNEIEIAKLENEVIFSYPIESISETIKRAIFMEMAIMSNKNSVILFDEPEANIFPFYNKQIAEMIGLDNSNQYFITTHSPYVLMSLIEKTPAKDLAVFICKMDNYQTSVHPIAPKQLPEFFELGSDVFYNLERFTNDNSKR